MHDSPMEENPYAHMESLEALDSDHDSTTSRDGTKGGLYACDDDSLNLWLFRSR